MQTATYEGELLIGGYPLKVIILYDGTRMFEKESFDGFLSRMEEENFTITEEDSKKLAEFTKLMGK